jgi:hypothetical protein
MRNMIVVIGSMVALGAGAPAIAETEYPAMAPLSRYAMASQAEEIALARSAAPASISRDADIMTFGEHGYEVAAHGANGFVCMVQRSWASGVREGEFWNPKLRGPICFNPAAARSVLPAYLERTKWVLEGASRTDIERRVHAAVVAGQYRLPAIGAMSFMMSKNGYLGDKAGGPWHPHLMLFQPTAAGGARSWGANLDGAQVLANSDPVEPITIFFIPVAKWSDGTQDGGSSGSKMHVQ